MGDGVQGRTKGGCAWTVGSQGSADEELAKKKGSEALALGSESRTEVGSARLQGTLRALPLPSFGSKRELCCCGPLGSPKR